jgi:hypothetical protein
MGVRREFEVWYDVEGRRFLNSAGAQLRKEDYPRIHYAEDVLMKLHLVVGNISTAYTGFGGTTFTAVLDTDWDRDTDVLIKSLDADIGASGDWSGGSGHDPANGRFAIRLNALTTTFDTAVDDKQEDKNTMLELKGYTGAALSSVIQVYFRAFNIMEWDGAVPSSPQTSLTVNQLTVDSIAGGTFRIGSGGAPASASAAGTQGDFAWDADYLYMCTALNTWKRTAIATW